MPLRVVVIVEGHGEDGAIRTLLTRIWHELLGGDYIEVISWREKQGRLRKKESLSSIVEAAAIKLHATERTDFRRLLLVMIDTDGVDIELTSPERQRRVSRTRRWRSGLVRSIHWPKIRLATRSPGCGGPLRPPTG